MLCHYKSKQFLHLSHSNGVLGGRVWWTTSEVATQVNFRRWVMIELFPAHTINPLASNTFIPPGLSPSTVLTDSDNNSTRKADRRILWILKKRIPSSTQLQSTLLFSRVQRTRIRTCDVIYELLKHLIQFMCSHSCWYSRSPNSRVFWISHDKYFHLHILHPLQKLPIRCIC